MAPQSPKRRWIVAVSAPVLLTLVFFAGPVYRMDETVPAVPIPAAPAALETYLAASEQRHPDIVPGAEKTIVWAHADRRKTPLSIIYLHGFSASRQEVAPLCDELGAELGANVFYTRLAGHGRSPKAMGDVQGNEWLQDATEALAIGRELGERVIVVGTSTGGTLALWLAQRDRERIAALVLISPNLGPRGAGAELLAGPWGAQVLRVVMGPEHRWEPANAAQARYWNWQYPSVALLPMMALVKNVRESPLESITTPTLVLYSPQDQVVEPGETERAFARLGAARKRLQAVTDSADRSSHVLAGDILAARDTARVRAWIMEFLEPR
ncbi:MAG: alpha/beta hydrolase [Steroidobacteraceae bacterium]|jgi:pimeloyl-ACP methyl ester carboxylesterase